MKYRLLIMMFIVASVSIVAAAEEKEKIRTSSKKQGWLGVSIQDVTPRFAREQNLKIKEGAYVNEVVDESPADSAGIEEGDIVVEFAGKKIETSEDLTDAVRSTKPGNKVTLKVNRNGESKSIGVTIGRNRVRMPLAVIAPGAPRNVFRFSLGDVEGMELMELNKQLAEYFEIPGGKGVLVKEVEKDENAAKAGLKAGDVIVKIADETVKEVGDVREALADYDEGEKVTVEIYRKGKKSTVSLEVSEEQYGGSMYWRDGAPGNFNFHIAPQIDNMHRDLEMKLKELPRKQRELQKIESRMNSRGV